MNNIEVEKIIDIITSCCSDFYVIDWFKLRNQLSELNLTEEN